MVSLSCEATLFNIQLSLSCMHAHRFICMLEVCVCVCVCVCLENAMKHLGVLVLILCQQSCVFWQTT